MIERLRVTCFYQRTDCFKRLDGAGLIICVDRADQDGFFPNHLFELIKIYITMGVYRQIIYRKSFILKPAAAVNDRRMLDLRSDNVPAPALSPVSSSFERHVVSFGAAGCKIDFIFPAL